MPNYNQAPKIKYQGKKEYDPAGLGKAIRTHELESRIMRGVGQNMSALKIMLFVTGNAEGFAVAQKTIMDRCGMSKDSYYKSRQMLEDKGWIKLNGDEIIVDYDAIYELKSNECSTSTKGNESYTPIKGNESSTPIAFDF